MTKVIRVLSWAGGLVGNPLDAPAFIRPKPGDLARDTIALARDVRTSGQDMKRALDAEKSSRKR